MTRYTVHLFEADFPVVDTNIVHSNASLIDSGHLIMPSMSEIQYYNDAREIFGTEVKVRCFQYDMEKIQKRHHMRNKPTTHKEVDEYVVFENDAETVRIHVDRVAQYVVNTETDKTIVFHKPIARWVDNGDLVQFISSSLRTERNLPFVLNGIYLLSEEQLDVVAGMIRKPELAVEYKQNCHSLFITVREL